MQCFVKRKYDNNDAAGKGDRQRATTSNQNNVKEQQRTPTTHTFKTITMSSINYEKYVEKCIKHARSQNKNTENSGKMCVRKRERLHSGIPSPSLHWAIYALVAFIYIKFKRAAMAEMSKRQRKEERKKKQITGNRVH